MDQRRTRLLDAAVAVIACDGPRALTHRAVDAAAELPAGSTSNLFRTREALLSGVGDRLLELDVEAWASLGGALPSDLDDLADLLAVFASLTADRYADAARARFALIAERPAALAPHHGALLDTLAAHLDHVGLDRPRMRAMLVLDLLDGITLHTVTVRSSESPLARDDIAHAVRRLITG